MYVKTSNLPTFSGTDANVWIKIHGQNGVTDAIKLKGVKDPLNRIGKYYGS